MQGEMKSWRKEVAYKRCYRLILLMIVFFVRFLPVISVVGQSKSLEELINDYREDLSPHMDVDSGCLARVINPCLIVKQRTTVPFGNNQSQYELDFFIKTFFVEKIPCEFLNDICRGEKYIEKGCLEGQEDFFAYKIAKNCLPDYYDDPATIENLISLFVQLIDSVHPNFDNDSLPDGTKVPQINNDYSGADLASTQQSVSKLNSTVSTANTNVDSSQTITDPSVNVQNAQQVISTTSDAGETSAPLHMTENAQIVQKTETPKEATQAAMQTETVRTQIEAAETAIAQTEAFGTQTALAQIVTSEVAKQAAMHATIIAQRATATQAAIIKIEQERIDQKREFWIKIIGGMIVIVAGAAFWLFLKRRKRRASRPARRRSVSSAAPGAQPQERHTLRLEDWIPADPKTMEIGSMSSFLNFSFGNMQHQGRRDYQEDSFGFSDISDPELVAKRGILAIVADGMGGLKNGKSISERAIQKFRKSFVKFSPSGDIPRQMLALVMETNHDIYETDKQKGGTTLLCVYIYRNSMYWVSVGDSAIYLFRKGRIYQLNKEHNRLNDLYLRFMYREITREQLMTEPSLQGLTANIGRRELREVDRNLIELKLQSGDRLLLCTDGVSGRLTEKELLVAMSQRDAQACADALKRMILKKNAPKQDNFTAEVIFCD